MVRYSEVVPDDLRPIAIHIEEPESGAFRWVLTERDGGDGWNVIDRARTPAATYQGAMADGLRALQATVPDLDIGPRRSSQAEAASQPDPEAPVSHPASREADAGDPAFFGFGPAK